MSRFLVIIIFSVSGDRWSSRTCVKIFGSGSGFFQTTRSHDFAESDLKVKTQLCFSQTFLKSSKQRPGFGRRLTLTLLNKTEKWVELLRFLRAPLFQMPPSDLSSTRYLILSGRWELMIFSSGWTSCCAQGIPIGGLQRWT